jgi:hypothetical protein
VNFWRKDRRSIELLPGDPFYFKLRGSRQIAGRGYFREQLQLSIESAWDRFGSGNGVSTLAELERTTTDVLGTTQGSLNCLILDDVQVLAESRRPTITPEEFPPSILNCKYYADGSLSHIERAFASRPNFPALAGAQIALEEEGAFDPEFSSSARAFALRAICSRRGQPQFRSALMNAYGKRCCITGEGVTAVLEAAHIHPYRGDDTNHPTNGLLLRSDWHTLFDLGLWTVNPDLTVRISAELSKTPYGEWAGASLRLPSRAIRGPSEAALKYHRQKVFVDR